ncbi:FAD-dependent oxidoreductase [Rhodoplanes azumiensis]|uniref:FAD-dependent oxidoreductase n=1 Tax=Rhodoplanes azumiensis TaxID=1897628 RepID=A0ABW5AKL1_9BRAD
MNDHVRLEPRVAPCRAACPAGIDVPRYVREIRDGDFDAALATIREKIPFAAVCGYACFHPCEAKCARRQFDEPVAIRLLKRAAADLAHTVPPPAPAASTGRKVAVVGSGPAGLTAAYYLALKGHAVTVLEAASKPGGMLRWGIPEYRLPNDVVENEIAHITATGVTITTDTAVRSPEALLAEGHDAVLVATGAWTPVKLGVDGETAAGVLDGIDFLKRVNAGETVALGKTVAVIGGGNTAIDAARTAIRLGAQTTLVYRRGRIAMPASAEEIAEAEEEGLGFVFEAAPVTIEAGRLTCVKLAPKDGGSGRGATLVAVDGSAFTIACDTVIVAAGQQADAAALKLKVARGGTVAVDDKAATSVPGVFAAGDVVSGPSTIIDAIASGRTSASAVDVFLGGDGNIDPPRVEPVEADAPVGGPRRRRLASKKADPAARAKSFALVEDGFDAATARSEAERCLACQTHHHTVEITTDICKACGYCGEICTMGVFGMSDAFNAIGYQPAVALHPEQCIGCLKCFAVCPDFAIAVR